MEAKGLLAEVRLAMQHYRLTLSPGIYLFAPEMLKGKMTGNVIEVKADNPDHYVYPAESIVNFGFYPMGFLPESLKGAPPSWLSGYPFLRSVEKLSEAPELFLEYLKRHIEARMQQKDQAGSMRAAGRWSAEAAILIPENSP